MTIQTEEVKIKADVATVEADAVKAESWIKANWHYAVGFLVAGLMIGFAFAKII